MTKKKIGVRGDHWGSKVEGEKEENIHWLRVGRVSSGRDAKRMPKGPPSLVLNIYPKHKFVAFLRTINIDVFFLLPLQFHDYQFFQPPTKVF